PPAGRRIEGGRRNVARGGDSPLHHHQRPVGRAGPLEREQPGAERAAMFERKIEWQVVQPRARRNLDRAHATPPRTASEAATKPRVKESTSASSASAVPSGPRPEPT